MAFLRENGPSHIVPFDSKGLLPPATKLRQGNVFTPVCQSFCSQGGVCHTPPWSDTPWADIPLGRHPLPWADTPQGDTPRQTPPLADTPGRYPWADTPWQTSPLPSACWNTHTPCPVHAGIHLTLPSACWDTHHPCPVHAGIHTQKCQCMLGYGQQVSSMHPTGMHSCFLFSIKGLPNYSIREIVISY